MDDYIVRIPDTSPYTSDEEIESTPLAEHIKQRQEKEDIQIQIERLKQKLGSISQNANLIYILYLHILFC